MKAFFVVLCIVVVFTAALYYLYYAIFCYPLKKRSDVHDIPESRLYKIHRNNMLEVVNEMENTPFEEVSICSTDGYRLYGKLRSEEHTSELQSQAAMSRMPSSA